MAKTYEILKHLPATGPMYVVVSDGRSYDHDHSEGFVVKFFKSNGDEWVANFKLGITRLNEVFELTEGKLLIIAGGAGYIMNSESEEPISILRSNYYEALCASDGRIVLNDSTEITIIDTDGSFWFSGYIALEGFQDLSIESNIVKGRYSEYINNYDELDWQDFSLDMDSKEITGLIQQPENIITSKPWRKIW